MPKGRGYGKYRGLSKKRTTSGGSSGGRTGRAAMNDRIAKWTKKAATLRVQAADVERSGTGNIGAAKRFRRAAAIYIDRIHKLRRRR